MPRQIRAGPNQLLQRARSELGRALEEDWNGAGAVDGPGQAPLH